MKYHSMHRMHLLTLFTGGRHLGFWPHQWRHGGTAKTRMGVIRWKLGNEWEPVFPVEMINIDMISNKTSIFCDLKFLKLVSHPSMRLFVEYKCFLKMRFMASFYIMLCNGIWEKFRFHFICVSWNSFMQR